MNAMYESTAAGADCPTCRAAMERMNELRRQPRAEDKLSPWFWGRQRREIHEAVFAPARPRWIAIGALGCVLAAAVAAMQPAPPPPAPPAFSQEDLKFLQEVSETANRVEPRVLAPMHLLWAR